MDRFTTLTLFVRAVERGSLAAAAREMELSPTAASRHLAELEKRLGVRLLNRTTRKLAPTEIGRELHQRAKRILDDLCEAEDAASQAQAEPKGEIRVSAPMSLGLAHIAPLIPPFLAAHPQVSIDLQLSDRVVDLLDEGFDLALRARGALPDSTLVARRLAPIARVLSAAPGYLAAHGAPAHPRDLAGHACLIYTLAAEPTVWRFVGPDGTEEAVTVAGRYRCNNGSALLDAAAAGAGIVLMPTFIGAQALARGALVPLLPDWRIEEQALYAVTPAGRLTTPKVRSLIAHLAERMRIPPWETQAE